MLYKGDWLSAEQTLLKCDGTVVFASGQLQLQRMKPHAHTNTGHAQTHQHIQTQIYTYQCLMEVTGLALSKLFQSVMAPLYSPVASCSSNG